MPIISKNTDKLLERWRGSFNEYTKLVALVEAADTLPELGQHYLLEPLHERLEELLEERARADERLQQQLDQQEQQ